MNEQNKLILMCKNAGIGMLVTMAAGAGILWVLSWLVANGTVPEDYIAVGVTAVLILASGIGGFISVRLQGKTAAVTALLSGIMVLLVLMIGSVGADGISFLQPTSVRWLVAVFSGSLVGGMLGTGSIRTRKRRTGKR